MGGFVSSVTGNVFEPTPSIIPANHFTPFTFCQLGDIQIGFGQDGWKNDAHRMHLAAQQVNTQGFDFCIAVGDLTHNRFPHEINAFQETYPEFEVPVHLLPGNHDINNVSSLHQFTQDFNTSDHSTFSHNGYRFILLNSITMITDKAEFKNYTIAEWTWFEHQLKTAAHAGERIVVAHHHLPFEVTEDEDDSYWTFPKRVRKRYLKLIRKYAVRHILVGHRHETKKISPADRFYTIYVVAGTARFFDGNGFGINYFNVTSKDAARDVLQEYVHLQGVTHMKRSEGQPTGCPDIFEHGS
ncbi:Metallo-dependent phosphatase-like protein [Aspergillus coremiiformis]|uniref:Metallo-dependent phosphatase-like protein n=1 Tax=Aspergillus coremiiformis TaxID=138285 RepID=A0A5N6ZG33_9EURO|nr:Metallo-dependent phosphatase-like protein [Aspergillus coremiiformis]